MCLCAKVFVRLNGNHSHIDENKFSGIAFEIIIEIGFLVAIRLWAFRIRSFICIRFHECCYVNEISHIKYSEHIFAHEQRATNRIYATDESHTFAQPHSHTIHRFRRKLFHRFIYSEYSLSFSILCFPLCLFIFSHSRG